ncbi:aspartic peptidase domain-containing protein [Lipomyces kononenkoae]|uniref:Aspartic peptidase domain-containing protein n=1 Tax=Lipomyces kononenkoae TaxID=34357 RepID=A0ACC3T956_LIPKO
MVQSYAVGAVVVALAAGISGQVLATTISFPLTQRIGNDIDCSYTIVPEQVRCHGHQQLSDQQPFVSTFSDESRRGLNSVQISRNSAVYTVSIGVGTPPQMQSLLVDTGSADVVIFGSASQQCRESSWGCGGGYNPVASSTYKNMDMSFAFGFANESDTARGSFIRDDIRLGDYLVRGQQFALVEDSIVDFDIEGVLGLGYKSMQQTEVKYDTIASKLCPNGLNSKPIYSLYLDSRHRQGQPRPKSEKSFKSRDKTISSNSSSPQAMPMASLDLGFIDAWKHAGDKLAFVPCTSKHEFSVALSDITISRSSASSTLESVSLLNKNIRGKLNVLLDSGTIGILMPDNIADAMASRISSRAVYDNGLPGYRLPCVSIPNSASDYFEFSFNTDQTFAFAKKKTVKVAFTELYRELNTTTSHTNEKMCMLDIVRGSTYGIGNILGTAFLSSVYAVFDVDAHRVGIAQASYYNM